MHLWITQAQSEYLIPGAMVAVPERQCLTYSRELMRHLVPGTTIHLYDIDPNTGKPRNDWRFKCT